MTASARIRLLAVLAGLVLPLTLQAQNARPDTHTVNRGDTLWDLARTYLGDPLLWPEIYRINTNVVEDPHWIYPGEILRLNGGADVSAVPTTDTPPPAAGADVAVEAPASGDSAAMAADPNAAAPDDAAPDAAVAEPQPGDLDVGNRVDNRDNVDLTPLVGRNRRNTDDGPSLEVRLARAYKPVRRSEFYSSGFLTEGRQLPLGTMLGTVTPLQIQADNTKNTAQMFTRVAIKPPVGGAYQVGDTLLLVRVMGEVHGYGNAIVPTGLVRVLDVDREENVGEVIAAYGQISAGQHVLPAEKFLDPGNVRPVPISDGVQATVLAHRDAAVLTGPQDVIFLSKGRADGVALGDMFELRSKAYKREGAASVTNEMTATVQVVHVSDKTSTARVIRVSHPNVPSGSEARQIAKLPS